MVDVISQERYVSILIGDLNASHLLSESELIALYDQISYLDSNNNRKLNLYDVAINLCQIYSVYWAEQVEMSAAYIRRADEIHKFQTCLLYTSPSPRDS